MMTKLKCLFGKLLKPLFIISLISCFTLLGNSFVNAQDFRLGLNTPVQGSNWSGANFRLMSYGNFLTNGSYKYFINNPNYDYYVSLSWIDRKLYVIVSDGNLNVQNQGFVNCFGLGDYRDDPNGFYAGGCGTTDTPISLTPDEFYGSGVFKNPDGFKVIGKMYTQSHYCFIYSDINKQVCFIADSDPYNQLNLFTGSLGFTSNPKPEDFAGSQLANRVGNSPFGNAFIDIDTGTVINPPSDKVYYSDNNQIYYDTFKALGFDEGLCYSNFALNDKVDIYTAYYDLFPSPSAGSGASVFDLYNSWSLSSINPFRSWYSVYNKKYEKLESSNDKGTTFINSVYSGDSKGDFYIFDKVNNTVFIDSYTFSPIDFNTFCDMAINGFDSDGLFTGDTSISFDNIMISSPCIRNGTCISDNGQFILSGSDTYGYFSGDADITEVFNGLYSNFKNAFRVDSSLEGTRGLLPNYIIFGFLIMLLLYLLKR